MWLFRTFGPFRRGCNNGKSKAKLRKAKRKAARKARKARRKARQLALDSDTETTVGSATDDESASEKVPKSPRKKLKKTAASISPPPVSTDPIPFLPNRPLS